MGRIDSHPRETSFQQNASPRCMSDRVLHSMVATDAMKSPELPAEYPLEQSLIELLLGKVAANTKGATAPGSSSFE